MICQFKYIELVSKKAVYLLENVGKSKKHESKWLWSCYRDEKGSFFGEWHIPSDKNPELNDIIEKLHNKKEYEVDCSDPSNDPSVLCICMPHEVLTEVYDKITGFIKL